MRYRRLPDPDACLARLGRSQLNEETGAHEVWSIEGMVVLLYAIGICELTWLYQAGLNAALDYGRLMRIDVLDRLAHLVSVVNPVGH